MATSLASQLQRLSTAQTALYQRQRTTKVSFLFDARKAAEFDIDTYHAIGQSGFKELVQLQPAIQIHWRNLFSDAAKDYERAMQDTDTNKRIDNELDQFVYKIAPYFLVRPCHKVIEWLIQRFHIHTFNADLLMRMALPYHQSNYFVRLVQVIDTEAPQNQKWQWLAGVKKEGMPLTLSNMVDRCFADNRFFEFACDMYYNLTTSTDKYALNEVHLKFATALFVTVVEQHAASLLRKSSAVAARKASKLQLKSLYRGLLPAVKSNSNAILSGAYIILLRMHALMELDEKLLSAIINTLLSSPTAHEVPETLMVVAVFLSKMARDDKKPNVSKMLRRIIDSELFEALPKALRQSSTNRPHVACLKWLAEAILFELVELRLIDTANAMADDIADAEEQQNQFSNLVNKIPFADAVQQRLLAVLMSKIPAEITADENIVLIVKKIGSMISLVNTAYPHAWPEYIKARMTKNEHAGSQSDGVDLFNQLQALQRIDEVYFGKLASIAIISHQFATVVKTEQFTSASNEAGKSKSDNAWKNACVEQILSSLRDPDRTSEELNKPALATDLCRIMEKSINDPSTITKIVKESTLVVQYAGETEWKHALLEFFSNFFEQNEFWRRDTNGLKNFREMIGCVIEAITALCNVKHSTLEVSGRNENILPEAHAIAVMLLFSLPPTSTYRADVLMRLSKLPYFVWLTAPSTISENTKEKAAENFNSSTQLTRLLCRRLLSCDKNLIDHVLFSLLHVMNDGNFKIGERFAFHALNMVSIALVAQQQKPSTNYEALVLQHLLAVNKLVSQSSADYSLPASSKKPVDELTIVDVGERKFISTRKILDEIFSGWVQAALCGLSTMPMMSKSKKIPNYLAPMLNGESSGENSLTATTRHQHQQTTYETYLLQLCRLAFVTLDSPRMSRLRAITLALFAKRFSSLSSTTAAEAAAGDDAATHAISTLNFAVSLMNNVFRCLVGRRAQAQRGAVAEQQREIQRALAFFTSVFGQLNLPSISISDDGANEKQKINTTAAFETVAAELENNLTILLFLTLPRIKSSVAGEINVQQNAATTAHLVVNLLATVRSSIKSAIPRRLLKSSSVKFIQRVVLNVEREELIGGNGEIVLCNSIAAYAATQQHATLDSLISLCVESDATVDTDLKNSFLPLLSRIESLSLLMPLFSTAHTVIADRYRYKKSAETLSSAQFGQIVEVLRFLNAFPVTTLLDTKSFLFSGLIMPILQLAVDNAADLDENFVQVYCVLIDELAKKPLLQSISTTVDDETTDTTAAAAAQHTMFLQILRILARHEHSRAQSSRTIYSQTLSWLTTSNSGADAGSGRRHRVDTELAVRVVDELVASLSSVAEEVSIKSSTPDDEMRKTLLISNWNASVENSKSIDLPAVQWRMLVILLQILVVNTPKKSASLKLLLEPLCRAMRLLAAVLPSALPATTMEKSVDQMEVDDDPEAKLERDFLLSLGNCLRMLTVVLKQLRKLNDSSMAVDLLPVNEVMRCIERVRHAGIVRLALALLTHIADRAPLNVLHQSMTLFAFMGSHMAHKEDEWSLSVLTSTLRCLIPTLMRSCCGDADNNENEADSTKKLTLAVKIVSTFLDALPHFAPHYVQPVLSAIVKALGKANYLWLFTAMLLRTYVQHQCALSDDEIEKSSSSAKRGGLQRKWPPAFPFILEQFFLDNNNDAGSANAYHDDSTVDDQSNSAAVDTGTEDDEFEPSKGSSTATRTTPSSNNNTTTWQPVRAIDSLISSPVDLSSKKRSVDGVDAEEIDDRLQAYAASDSTENHLTAADLLYNIQQLVELAMQLPSNDMMILTDSAQQQSNKSSKLPKYLRTAFSTAFFATHNNSSSTDSSRRWRKNTGSNVVEYDHDSLEIMQMNRLRLSLLQFSSLLVENRAVWHDKNLGLLSNDAAGADDDDERKRLKSNMSALLFRLNRAQVYAREQSRTIAVQLKNETQQEPATTTDEDEEDEDEDAVVVERRTRKRRRQRNSDSVRSHQETFVTLFYEIYETSVDYWQNLFGGAVHRTTTTLLSVIPARFFVRVAVGFLKGSVLSIVRQQQQQQNASSSLDAVENALSLVTEALVLRGSGQNNEISALTDGSNADKDDTSSYTKLINVFLNIVRDQNFAEHENAFSSFMFPAKCKAAAVAGLARLCRILATSTSKPPTIAADGEIESDSQNSAVLLIIDSLAEEMSKAFKKVSESYAENENENKQDDIVVLHALLDAVLLLAHKMHTQYMKLIHTTTQCVLRFLLHDAQNNPILVCTGDGADGKTFSFATTSKALLKLSKNNPWQSTNSDDRHYTQSLRAALQFLTLHVESFAHFLSTRALEQLVQLCWKFEYAVKITKSSLRIKGRHEIDKLRTALFSAVDAGTIAFRTLFKVFGNLQRNGELQQALSGETINDESMVLTLPLSLLAAAIKKCQTKELFSAATEVAQLLFSLLTLCSNHEIDLLTKHNKNVFDTERMQNYAPLFDVMLTFCMCISPLMFQHLVSRLTTWAIAGETDAEESIFVQHVFVLHTSAHLSANLRSAFVHLAAPVLELIMGLLEIKSETEPKDLKKSIVLSSLSPSMRIALLQPLYSTIHNMIANDRQEFFDKMRVEALLKCIFVPFRQFSESTTTTTGIRDNLRHLSVEHVGPMLVALGSGSAAHYRDVYIRDLNEQLCELASEHSLSAVRECALRIMLALMQSSFGNEFQTLLPDTAQALHQVMEDDDGEVLKVCNDVLKQAEKINGEPIADLMS